MKKLSCFILLLILQQTVVFSQSSKLNRQLFFLDDHTIEVNLTTDIKQLRNSKNTPAYQPAEITMKFSDTLVLKERIRVELRGEYRKRNCDLAALMLNFRNTSSPLLSPLKKLKLVGGCRNGSSWEELLIKEYLVYKIQNMLSNMSFRVRLLHITYHDSRQKVKTFSQYAFLLEDMIDLAERNNCVEIKNRKFLTEGTNREQMTFVNLFQYMIGNTDWSIPNYHNIKLMVPKNDTLARPYAVPYDFDYCGLVDANYAVPAEGLNIESVRNREYRGFSRGYDELVKAAEIFNEKKEGIKYYIDHFELCSARTRKLMSTYLDEFYETINNKNKVKSVFIMNARTQ
ncbi:MAG: hypothetical protein ABIO81_03415 [Ginsengibacter sp.]